MDDEKDIAMGEVIRIDEARIRDHLGEMVRGTVEEALNAMLDVEADRLCGAGRYERTQARRDTRAGSYERALHTKAGEVRADFERAESKMASHPLAKLIHHVGWIKEASMDGSASFDGFA